MARVALVSLLAVACVPDAAPRATASPIVAGSVDEGDPAVVALLGGDLCTGTLIASRVVITAAHCTLPSAVYFGTDVRFGGREIAVVEELVHPRWNPVTLELDVALLLLAEDGLAPPARLNDVLLGEAQLGQEVRIVGFGETAVVGGERGVKRQASSRLRDLRPSELEYGGTEGQSCFGDSGGPVFMTLGGDERLAGVTSNGDATCAVFGAGPRIDQILNDFIRPYLAAHPDCRADGACRPECGGADPDCGSPGTLVTGQACREHADCATRLCIAAVDDPARRYCSEACTLGGVGCPVVLDTPMACTPTEDPALAVCAWSAPTPGSVGWPCADESVCTDGLCVPTESEGRQCSRACDGADGVDCPLGFRCADDPLAGGARYCVPAGPGGGCRAVPEGRRGPLGLILLGALVLALGCYSAVRRHGQEADRHPHRWR